MEELVAARFNLFWYLSLIAPAAIMLTVTYFSRKTLLITGIVLSLLRTYLLCNVSVQQKWKIRNELARTDEEMEYATADGANRVFTAFVIGPFEALLYTSFWGICGWRLWRLCDQKKQSSK